MDWTLFSYPASIDVGSFTFYIVKNLPVTFTDNKQDPTFAAKLSWSFHEFSAVSRNYQEQAGAELGQAQVKLRLVFN